MPEQDFNLLVALDTLLADGSVTGAARRLGLSTSAMSRTLTRLREATGDPLLVRAGRHMVLTPYAVQIRERTQTAVHEARSLLRPSATELDLASVQRTFTIRANDAFVEVFAPALIAAATAAAPLVQLRFAPKADKASHYLREGVADLEVGVVGNMGPELRVQALFRDRFVGVVRQGHPLEQAPAVTAERYAACGHVVASRRGHKRGPVDEALAALGLERRVVAIVPGFPAALSVALVSDLVALVPASYVSHRSAPERRNPSAPFHVFDLPVATAAITVSQIWHPRLEADPAHRWLRQLMVEMCR